MQPLERQAAQQQPVPLVHGDSDVHDALHRRARLQREVAAVMVAATQQKDAEDSFASGAERQWECER